MNKDFSPLHPADRIDIKAKRRHAVRLMMLAATLVMIAITAAFVPIAQAAPGQRSADVVTATMLVDYRDLDITQPADVALLKKRVKRAASEVCKTWPKKIDAIYRESPRCFIKTVADGKRQIARAVARANEAKRIDGLALNSLAPQATR